jgi:hypothetical protein
MSGEEEHSRGDDAKSTLLEVIVEAFPLIIIPGSLIQELISMIRGESAVTTLDLKQNSTTNSGEKK